jgi:hypothetical protein
MPFAKTIVESELVVARMDAAIKKHPRLGEVYESMKWHIARDPNFGTALANTNPVRRIAKTYTWKPGGAPSLSLVFRVTQNEVFIEASRYYESGPGAAA